MINEIQAHKYCRDDISKIENYEKAVNDPTQTWHLHHRLELTLDGEFALTVEQLKLHDMYYNRPYYELIFLTQSEHIRIHKCGRTHTEETRRRISESNKGKTSHWKGKHLSLEHRRKISGASKGKKATDETRMKISLSNRGKHSAMYGRHHTEETKQRISNANKGKLKGKPKTEEQRRKMSEAAKRRWASIKK